MRIHYLAPSTLTGDALFDSIPWTIWTTIECNIAIIAASLPSIIPLLKKLHALRKGANTSSHKIGGNTTQEDVEQSDEDATKRDVIPKIRIDEEELMPLDSDYNEDISQMYANASRNIPKRTTPQTSNQEDRL